MDPRFIITLAAGLLLLLNGLTAGRGRPTPDDAPQPGDAEPAPPEAPRS